MTVELMKKYAELDMSPMLAMRDQTVMGSVSSRMASSMKLWKELLSGDDENPVNEVIKKQYDVIYGRWPSRYDEVILFVDENNEIDDMTLYALGLKPEEEMKSLMDAALNRKPLITRLRNTYEEYAVWIFVPY